jgi:hypothetical protein
MTPSFGPVIPTNSGKSTSVPYADAKALHDVMCLPDSGGWGSDRQVFTDRRKANTVAERYKRALKKWNLVPAAKKATTTTYQRQEGGYMWAVRYVDDVAGSGDGVGA